MTEKLEGKALNEVANKKIPELWWALFHNIPRVRKEMSVRQTDKSQKIRS